MTDRDEDAGTMWDRNKKQSAALTISGRHDSAQQALARVGSAIQSIGAVVRAGETVEADAQRLLLALASYGEGERRGRFAFSGAELCGVEEQVNKIPERNPDGSVARDSYGQEVITTKTTWIVAPTEHALGIPAPRLSDAVKLLVGRGWATTTEDGPIAPGCDFYEVKLTATGREAAQRWVGRAQDAYDTADEGGARLPSIFDDPLANSQKPRDTRDTTDLEHFTSMLARARIAHTVDGGDDSTDTTAVRVGKDGFAVFTFDEGGKLVGVGEKEKA